MVGSWVTRLPNAEVTGTGAQAEGTKTRQGVGVRLTVWLAAGAVYSLTILISPISVARRGLVAPLIRTDLGPSHSTSIPEFFGWPVSM